MALICSGRHTALLATDYYFLYTIYRYWSVSGVRILATKSFVIRVEICILNVVFQYGSTLFNEYFLMAYQVLCKYTEITEYYIEVLLLKITRVLSFSSTFSGFVTGGFYS
jgi:hypothetical protein